MHPPTGQPIVMIDGVEHPASVTEDVDFWYIHVTYSYSEHQITIGGSNTVPEFPPIPLLAIIFILAMIILRRRRSQYPQRQTVTSAKAYRPNSMIGFERSTFAA